MPLSLNHLTLIFGSLAALLHAYFFVLESLQWGQPKVNQMFQVTPEQADATRVFAFNQGFYNLFLALGLGAGLVSQFFGYHPLIGMTLIIFTCVSMVGAAIILLCSTPKSIRGALVQGLPPLATLLTIAQSLLKFAT